MPSFSFVATGFMRSVPAEDDTRMDSSGSSDEDMETDEDNPEIDCKCDCDSCRFVNKFGLYLITFVFFLNVAITEILNMPLGCLQIPSCTLTSYQSYLVCSLNQRKRVMERLSTWSCFPCHLVKRRYKFFPVCILFLVLPFGVHTEPFLCLIYRLNLPQTTVS